MTESIEREVLGMCNISDGVYERGRLSGIVDMCKEFGVSFIDTVKKIAADFNLSEQEAEEEVRKYW